MKLLWLDLEATGLYARKHDILELAASIADLHDPFNALPVYDAVACYPRHMHVELDKFVFDMHTKNGLLEDCALDSALDIRRIEQDLLDLVPMVEDRDDRTTLAGSSIHFDHEFVSIHMPELAKRLSHRHYDVSALKLYCQSMGMPRFRKAEAHRARPDIEESIMHAGECTEWLKNNLVTSYAP